MQNISSLTILSAAIFVPYNVFADTSYSTHTYTPIEIEAVSASSKSITLASVCFLGVGDCASNTVDYGINDADRCRNEGFVSSCPAGQKLHSDKRCSYNSSYGTCCTEKCPENSATSCSGTVVADDGCGYSCKSCDPCPGYYDCGGTWQYCSGKVCYNDSSRCSVFCKSDYFPNKCDDKNDCKGIYRNGYCSADCTPACTESCYGDSLPKTGEGWFSSSCTTCSGGTLYNNSAKACPSGYSTTVDSCDTSAGYRLVTSGKSGDSVCGKCTNSVCPDGYDTSVKSCSSANGYVLETNGASGGQTCGKCVPAQCPDGYVTSVKSCSSANGYVLETNGISGGNTCGKCVPAQCPDGYSTTVTTCTDVYTLRTSGKSGGEYCRKCDCTATDTSCSFGKEVTASCVKNGTTYYLCDYCTRTGGSAEGYKTCSGKSNPTGALVCGGETYYQDCGCQGFDADLYNCENKTIISYTSYDGNVCEMFTDGINTDDACYENKRLKTFKSCGGYVCANGWSCDSKASFVPSSGSYIGYTCSGGESSDGFHWTQYEPTLK